MQRTIFDADHEAFRATCRTFVDRQLRPHQEKHIANHEFGREVWLELGKQGLLGLNVPHEYGGSSVGDPRFSLILAEELAKLAFAYSSCVGIHAELRRALSGRSGHAGAEAALAARSSAPGRSSPPSR